MSEEYISRKTVAQSYRPKSWEMSPGLKRARAPFRVRNAITGIAVGAFVVSIWAYSIRAVRQEVFDDVDEEAKALAEERKRNQALKTQTGSAVDQPPMSSFASASAVPSTGLWSTEGRGLLLKWFPKPSPWLFDPRSKTFVWGAPSVDNIGKLRRSS